MFQQLIFYDRHHFCACAFESPSHSVSYTRTQILMAAQFSLSLLLMVTFSRCQFFVFTFPWKFSRFTFTWEIFDDTSSLLFCLRLWPVTVFVWKRNVNQLMHEHFDFHSYQHSLDKTACICVRACVNKEFDNYAGIMYFILLSTLTVEYINHAFVITISMDKLDRLRNFFHDAQAKNREAKKYVIQLISIHAENEKFQFRGNFVISILLHHFTFDNYTCHQQSHAVSNNMTADNRPNDVCVWKHHYLVICKLITSSI